MFPFSRHLPIYPLEKYTYKNLWGMIQDGDVRRLTSHPPMNATNLHVHMEQFPLKKLKTG